MIPIKSAPLNSLEIIQNYHDLVEDIEILNKSAEQEEVSEVTTETDSSATQPEVEEL